MSTILSRPQCVNKYIFLNENLWISIRISQEFVPALVQLMVATTRQAIIWTNDG